MNKVTSKYFRTAALMDQALLELLQRKAFDYITVKDVCERAGVNRSTFYLHYNTTRDLLTETMERLYDQLKAQYTGEREISSHQIVTAALPELYYFVPKYSLPYLQFIQANKNAFRMAFNYPDLFDVNKQAQQLNQQYLAPILHRFGVPSPHHDYYLAFFQSGIHAIIKQWLAGDCRDDINLIAELIAQCVLPGVRP